MTNNILILDDKSKFKFKREWSKEEIKNIKLIPEEFDVQKWTEFLPPLIQ